MGLLSSIRQAGIDVCELSSAVLQGATRSSADVAEALNHVAQNWAAQVSFESDVDFAKESARLMKRADKLCQDNALHMSEAQFNSWRKLCKSRGIFVPDRDSLLEAANNNKGADDGYDVSEKGETKAK